MLRVARDTWADLGEDPGQLAMASELLEFASSGAPIAK
jgi:hypothetical protein